MEKIVIIGNGKRVLKLEKKDFIDSSTVIRINNFKIEGYEKFVGTRTDFYSCSPRYLNYIDLTDLQRLSICEQNFKESVEKHKSEFTEEEIKARREPFFRIYTSPKVESSKLKEILQLFTTRRSDVQSYPFANKITVSDIEFDQNYSTGLRTILYCMNRFKNHQIYITGFDSFMSSGWYWDDHFNMADKYARTQNYTDGHPYLIERDKIRELVWNKGIIEI